VPPLAPLPEGMAPLLRLVRRPPPPLPAGGAGGKIGGRSKKKRCQKFTYTFLPLRLNTPLWRPKKIFMPLGRNPGSATARDICVVDRIFSTVSIVAKCLSSRLSPAQADTLVLLHDNYHDIDNYGVHEDDDVDICYDL
jgi:hypothetical protein